MDLREVRRENVNWIKSAQITVQWRGSVNTVLNTRVPWR